MLITSATLEALPVDLPPRSEFVIACFGRRRHDRCPLTELVKGCPYEFLGSMILFGVEGPFENGDHIFGLAQTDISQ